ncbi:MAG TPA: hypothetical protein VFF76_05550 [Holophagaceae bacterium]|jgi:hypothetical protein|nr:hypothetical protein [Holophagaceae bacterium]
MRIYARSNHIGWIHLWARREAFENGEPSDHFFNGRTDPRWIEAVLSTEQREALAKGQLVEIEDPGYLGED